MNTKKNKQFQETHQLLQSLITKLLSEKDITKITVSELCKLAQINRSTFYYHYLDAYDLAEKTFAQTNKELLTTFKLSKTNEPFSETTFYEFFQFIKDNRHIYRLTNASRTTFPIDEGLEQMTELFQSKNLHEVPDKILKGQITFFQAGFTFLLRNWLLDDCRQPIGELIIVLKSFNMIEN